MGDGLSLAAHMAAQIAIVVIAGWSGVRAFEHGTLPYVALGVLLLAIAAGGVVWSIVFLVALARTSRPTRADP
jgi:hypothetical protein